MLLDMIDKFKPYYLALVVGLKSRCVGHRGLWNRLLTLLPIPNRYNATDNGTRSLSVFSKRCQEIFESKIGFFNANTFFFFSSSSCKAIMTLVVLIFTSAGN